MALPAALKRALAEAELPEDQAVRARAELFMMKSGFTMGDLAAHIGYSAVSLRLYLAGKYCEHHQHEGNTRLFRARLTEYLDNCDFAEATGPRGTLYKTGTHAVIRKAFTRALNHRADNHGFAYCIDGAPGMQKSYIAESLVRELAKEDAGKNGAATAEPEGRRPVPVVDNADAASSQRVARRAYYIYCGDHNSPQEMLKQIAIEMGLSARGFIEQLIKKIQFELARRRGILVFDEAHHLPKATLERIRQLLDRPPYIGMIFLGSHDLQRTFADLHMEQWRRRVVETIVLRGLEREEAESIILGEMRHASPKQIDSLIEASIVPDWRYPIVKGAAPSIYPYSREQMGRSYEAYLSAGALFAAIQQIQIERQEKAVASAPLPAPTAMAAGGAA